MSPKTKHHRPNNLTTEVRELRNALRRAYQTRRQLSLAFLKGVVSTLGAIATVVIIMPLVIWTIQKIAWPPLIADIVADVILQYEQANPRSQRGAADQ